MISVNTKNTKGAIKPLNGVNNGPLSTLSVDKSDEFKRARIPYSRLHDTEGMYGSGVFVNIHCVFPNFEADVNDPNSYFFDATDIYIKAIVDAGTEVFYRLGETIETTNRLKIFVRPPKDYIKWAEICEHIIMHYNDGWANGFHYDIKYWEIWNEPDSPDMWADAKAEDYYELYHITATHLKNKFPYIKIGGFASSGFYEITRPNQAPEVYTWIPFARGFLDYITRKDKKSPIDFFSWHIYPFSPDEVGIHARYVDTMLSEYGFENVENILDEWNYCDTKDIEDIKKRRNHFGAAFMGAVLAEMQNSPITLATYYDAEIKRYTYCGIFDHLTFEVTKGYYALYYFGMLRDLGIQIEASSDNNRVYIIGAKNDNKAGLYITNFSYMTENEVIKLDSFAKILNVYATNESLMNETQNGRLAIDEKTNSIVVSLKPYELLYIELEL